jgi:hypothetical protein
MLAAAGACLPAGTCPFATCKLHAGDIDCLAEFARASSQGVNDYDDEGQAPLHVAADKGISEAVSILTGEASSSSCGVTVC